MKPKSNRKSGTMDNCQIGRKIVTNKRSWCILRGVNVRDLLGIAALYLGCWFLWSTGRMIKADLGKVDTLYQVLEVLLFIVTAVFALCLFMLWFSTAWVSIGEIRGAILFFTGAWIVYTFIRVMLRGR